MPRRFQFGAVILAPLAIIAGTTSLTMGQEATESPSALTDSPLTELGIGLFESSELSLWLAPLPLARLEAVLENSLVTLQEHGEALAAKLVEQRQLSLAVDPDPQIVEAVSADVTKLTVRKAELISRASVVIDAVELKGGDVEAAQAYVTAIGALGPEDTIDEQVSAADTPVDLDAVVRKRVTELVAIVRAEPPAHERPVPWNVPLSELELELQPLPMEAILERIEKWREILQREVRKRVRIDILLNDSEKLEQTRARRRNVDEASGATLEDIELVAIKSRLAERSQEQQRIINDIVARMEVAILLVKRRGGDADKYTKYITASTGQKLNLTDPSVLQAQILAWLRSPDGGISIGLDITKFIGIVFLFWVLSRLLGGIAAAAVRRVPKSSSLLAPVLVGTIRRVTIFVGLVIGVSMLGVNIGPLLAMIGAAGLVIGLALQGTLSNFASGILILLNRPYDVGHVINAGGVFGKVEAMNLVSTSILTFDNQLMLVPNNLIWNGVVTNVTGKSTRRVDLTFGIGYADDMGKATKIIREVIEGHPKVHREPAAIIRVNELADNSVNVIARPWAATADYWDVYWDVVHDVKTRFDAEGINIPFPQRDVHMTGPLEVKLSRSQ